jgi:hypothetical protein
MGMLSGVTNVAAAVGTKIGAAASGTINALGTVNTVASAVGGQQVLGSSGDIAADSVGTETGDTLQKYNDMQNKLAVQSMAMQVAGLQRSMVMQGLRDLIKDAKDTIKDQGEAGHKP